MLLRSIVLLICLNIFSVGLYAQEKNAVPYGDNPAVGNYLDNNGVKIYYEVYGTGQPLVLIHGNGGSIKGRAWFIDTLSKKYKVIMMDNRCHGKSACPSGYLTYEQMADDLNAVLNELHIDSVMIWGHSDGGIVGLLMAIHYPKKVKKLLASGANLRPDSTAVAADMFPLIDKMAPMVKNDSVMSKQFRLLVEQPHISTNELHQIKCDVLIMGGDRDAIRNEHTLEIFNNIPGALLCILPGTTHFVYNDRKLWFTEIMYDFFENPPKRTTTAELMMKQFQ